ncbi:MAG: hypothetical protein WBB07_14205 [Mycobacterium sp.]
MRRGITVSCHALSFLLSAVLFFLFVLPRWWEFSGGVSPGIGTTLRIVTGVLIGLTALPVAINLIKVRKPEFGTPQLALTLRVWSIVGHVLAGVLIVGAAIAEIWLSLDTAGQWLFGVYGAAAAIAVLGAAAFYLAFVAEMPPPPPKPLKPRKSAAPVAAAPVADEPALEESEADESVPDEVTTGDSDESSSSPDTDTTDQSETTDKDAAADDSPETGGRLRNRRPAGKSGAAKVNRRRGGGVAVSDD